MEVQQISESFRSTMTNIDAERKPELESCVVQFYNILN